jgi:segregation and condensation protein B
MNKISNINIAPAFIKLSHTDKKNAVESIIFASDEILSMEALRRIFIGDNIKPENIPNLDDEDLEEVQSTEPEYFKTYDDNFFILLIEEINTDLDKTNRPYHIVKAAGGYLFATKPEFGRLVQETARLRTKRRLSHAAMEVLAIIAYKQPVTKPEVELIRGVNSSEVINSLAEKNIVTIVGKRDTLGKPLLYGTTEEFLKIFGLDSLEELPRLREFDELTMNDDYPETTLEIKINPDEMMKHRVVDINSPGILDLDIADFTLIGQPEIIDNDDFAASDEQAK